MKRRIFLLTTIILAMSFCACNEMTADETETDSLEDALSGSHWIEVYTGNELKINANNAAKYAGYSGDWEVNGDEITIEYTIDGYYGSHDFEMELSLSDDNGFTVLKSDSGDRVFVGEDDVMDYVESIAIPLGETVSTNILTFELNAAPLAIYSVGPETSVSDGRAVNTDVCLLPNDGSSDYCYYEAARGHALVCLDFTVTNEDRTSINTNDDVLSFDAIVEDQYTSCLGYDLNENDGWGDLYLDHAVVSTDGGNTFYTNDTGNMLWGAGRTCEIRTINVVCVEPSDYDEPYYLIAHLQNSSGDEESFIFYVD